MSVLEKLQGERSDILNQIAAIKSTIVGHEREASCLASRAAGLMTAIQLLEAEQPAAVEHIEPRAPRMDIAAAVLAELETGPMTTAQLAEALGRKPGQVKAAAERLAPKVFLDGARWRRALAEAMPRIEQAAE